MRLVSIRRLFTISILISAIALAQTSVVGGEMRMWNHGGWEMGYVGGVNQGDIIRFDVKCTFTGGDEIFLTGTREQIDSSDFRLGDCLRREPWDKDGNPFHLVKPWQPYHQTYELTSPIRSDKDVITAVTEAFCVRGCSFEIHAHSTEARP